MRGWTSRPCVAEQRLLRSDGQIFDIRQDRRDPLGIGESNGAGEAIVDHEREQAQSGKFLPQQVQEVGAIFPTAKHHECVVSSRRLALVALEQLIELPAHRRGVAADGVIGGMFSAGATDAIRQTRMPLGQGAVRASFRDLM